MKTAEKRKIVNMAALKGATQGLVAEGNEDEEDADDEDSASTEEDSDLVDEVEDEKRC